MQARFFNRNRHNMVQLAGILAAGFASGQRNAAVDIWRTENEHRVTLTFPIAAMIAISRIQNLNYREALNDVTKSGLLFGLGFIVGYGTAPLVKQALESVFRPG